MSNSSKPKEGLKKGILHSYSGTINDLVFQKNGRIRTKRLKGRRKPKNNKL